MDWPYLISPDRVTGAASPNAPARAARASFWVLKLPVVKVVFCVGGTAASNRLCCHAVLASATERTAIKPDTSVFHCIVEEMTKGLDRTVDPSRADLCYLRYRAARLDH